MAWWVPLAMTLGKALLGGGSKKQARPLMQFQPYQPPMDTTAVSQEEFQRRLRKARELTAQYGDAALDMEV